MLKTFKYKLYPTKIQRHLMQETTFLCSLVYNQCLAQRKWRIKCRQYSLIFTLISVIAFIVYRFTKNEVVFIYALINAIWSIYLHLVYAEKKKK